MNLILFAILFAGILQGIILGVLLMRKKSNVLPNRILALIMGIMVIHLSLVAIDVQDLFVRLPHLSRISWVLPLWYGPLFLLLTQSLVIPAFRLRPVHLLYLLPFFIYLFALSPYFLSNADEKLAVLGNPELLEKADFGAYNYITNYIHILFGAASLYVFYSYRKKLPDFFSSTERIEFRWFERFLWGVLALMIFSWLCFVSRRYQWPFLSKLYPSNFLGVVFLIYWVSYKMLLQMRSVAVPPEPEMPSAFPGSEQSVDQPSIAKPKYQKTILAEEDAQLIKGQLMKLMQASKPYLDPELTLDDLCTALSVKRHQLSQVINTGFNKNFFEFVNSYRVEEFKRRVEEPESDQLSIFGLAIDCGFNSKATFNQVFKKMEGVTPSAYLRSQKG